MGQRLIRDWTDSEVINRLTPYAEVFFIRLLMKADDHGNFSGNPKLINASLFPLKEYSTIEIRQWIYECDQVGLVMKYEVDQKAYLHIPNFGQRLRSKTHKVPPPSADNLRTIDSNVRTVDSNETPKTDQIQSADNPLTIDSNSLTNVGLKRSRREVEVEVEVEENGSRNFDWFMGMFDEQFLEQMQMSHRGKNIQQAIRESFAHLGADEIRLKKADKTDCKRLLNTWLSNSKQLKKDERTTKSDGLKANLIRLAQGGSEDAIG